MAAVNNKIKVSALAKDLDVKNKAILSAIEKADAKATVLSEEEADLVIFRFAGMCEPFDIDKYINGEITLAPYGDKAEAVKEPEKNPEEAKLPEEVKKTEEQKPIEAKRPEEKKPIEAKRPEEKKPIEAKRPEERKPIEAKRPEERKPIEAKRPEERKPIEAKRPEEKKPIEAKRPEEKNPVETKRPEEKKHQPQSQPQQPVKKQEQKPAQKQGGVKLERNIKSTPMADTSVKKEVRVVDTRGTGGVDLSKYDEKLLDYVHDGAGESGRQKFNKKNNQKLPFDKKRAKGKPEAPKAPEKPKIPDVVKLPDEMIVSELAKELHITTAEVMKKLMGLGMLVTLNQSIDFDTAAIVADEFGSRAERIVVVTTEEKVIDSSEDSKEDLVERPPVVCVMGHVDHGKTSLLDAIRHANVTSGEAGGITQHIGAYRVNIGGRDITFLDTPGHEAFTAMRARGAQATDIAILVVAADDGIMPQTVEAINHAKAAGVSIIVAINKMDKPGANPDNIMQELTKYDLVPEEWGGDVICVPVSALTKMGIDDLLESVLLVAEVAELKANPNREARGIVIEAKLDKGRGAVATVLVQNGTLHAGDYIIAGTTVGRVRAMLDDKGKTVKTAGPSVPVEILGLSDVPAAGDILNAVKDERMARELADERRADEKERTFNANGKVSLNDLFNQVKEGIKELNIVVKADVQGSAEAVKASLEKLSNEEVRVRVIHNAVGGINENDVMLADASGAIIIGFNVRPDKRAIDAAAKASVDIHTYRIIYECIEEVEAAMKGMLAPTYQEVLLGHAEVRQTIRVPNVGVIAGSYILDGKITRNSQIRVVRDGIVVFEDKISSLKRFKDDAREVAQGYECGVGLEKFNDIKEGDVLEAFIMEEIKR